MKDEYILKTDVLKMIDLKKNKWLEIKGSDQDVTQENFVSNVIWAFDSVMFDIENM